MLSLSPGQTHTDCFRAVSAEINHVTRPYASCVLCTEANKLIAPKQQLQSLSHHLNQSSAIWQLPAQVWLTQHALSSVHRHDLQLNHNTLMSDM